jgi:prepilin-type N-terminal cleavage/methylation domain-containing protein
VRVSPAFTLVELMLALVVASIAILAAVSLYAHAGTMFRTAQSVQSLEETAQLAIMAMRHDIELAGFSGHIPFGEPIEMDESAPGSISVRNDCGEDWAIRITEPVGGSNDAYRWDCPAYARAAAPGADTLVVRYAEPEPAPELETGRIYLRTHAPGSVRVFVAPDGEAPAPDRLAGTHALRTRGYYVSTTSAAGTPEAAVPSLRAKTLTQRGGRAVVVDEEIQPGIEDLQVEFFVDSGHSVSAADLSPGDPVRAVRIWLLVRSEFRENGVGGDVIPAYAGRDTKIIADGYRRSLVTATIAITDDRPF